MTGPGRAPLEDAALVREVVAGSHDALAALYDRHGDAVFAAASRLTSDRGLAEEVVQETFLALWNRAETFDPSLGSLAAWLHTIARNRTVDRLRAAGRRPTLIPLSSAAASGPAAGGAGEADADALERVLAGGAIVAGAVPPTSPEMAAALGELRASLQAALADDARGRADRHRPRLRRGPVAIRDRRAAGLAAGYRQDPDTPGPRSTPGRARQWGRPGIHALSRPGFVGRARSLTEEGTDRTTWITRTRSNSSSSPPSSLEGWTG